MAIRRERFVTTKQFLDSARSLDITPIEGFYELFDNSFDADATSIRAHIEKGERNLRFYIIDNGRGIKNIHVDDEGISHQGFHTFLLTVEAFLILDEKDSLSLNRKVRCWPFANSIMLVHKNGNIHQNG